MQENIYDRKQPKQNNNHHYIVAPTTIYNIKNQPITSEEREINIAVGNGFHDFYCCKTGKRRSLLFNRAGFRRMCLRACGESFYVIPVREKADLSGST